MNLLTELSGHLMQAGIWLAAPFHTKARQMVAGRKEVWNRLADAFGQHDAPVVWMHVASLGEFEQGRPLLEAIRAAYPQYKLLITFFSPSGYNVRKDYAGADCVVYLPADTLANAVRFVDMVKPHMVLFVKYDLWPNFLHVLHERAIPTFLVSAIFRPSQLFFKPYGGWYRSLLHTFDTIFVQDEPSRVLLQTHQIDHVTVSGDTRFDRVLAIRDQAKEVPLIAHFASIKAAHDSILVAGSTWPQDEAFMLDYFNRHRHQKLIIAPHEIHEAHLQQIEALLHRPFVRLSNATESTIAQADCVIVDCFGLLSSIYRYGQMAYIGGGFRHGIHNTVEAAVYGIPVIFGPNHERFREARGLIEAGAAIALSKAEDYAPLMDKLLGDDAMRLQMGHYADAYIGDNLGATSRIMDRLKAYL